MAEGLEPVEVLSVADEHCQLYGCRQGWGLGNQIFIYAPARCEEGGESSSCCNPVIHEVKWVTDMHEPTARKLVNESQSTFLKLQQLGSDKKSKDKSQMIKISWEYRSVIQTCLMELQKSCKNIRNEAELKAKQVQLELFEVIELLWSLVEVLFVDAAPGGIFLSRLLEWMRLHFVEAMNLAKEAMQDERPDAHPSYWPAVYLLTLQGRIEDVRHMLSTHVDKDSEPLIIMDTLLKSMPIFGVQLTLSLTEFDMKWQRWQQQCQQALDEAVFASNDNLETLCKILCGDDDVFIELQELIGSWYCMMLSRLLYQCPTVSLAELDSYTQFCIEAYGGHSKMQPWDNILLAAMECDIHQVIKESSTVLGNWWFVAHLTDLLHHCGRLEASNLQYGSNLREFLLLEYASTLLSHNSLWQVGVYYLDHCPNFGRYHLEQFVEHFPLDTEKKALKILHICECRDMQDQIRSICKVMGMKAFHNKRLGSALSWALKSKDVTLASTVAEKLLFDYSDHGGFSNLDLLDNLGSSMLLCDKLTFLGKYREFHKLYEEGNVKDAGSLLLSLLTAKVAPKKFWPTLLMDALPLLEAKDVVFSSKQTYELMHCVEHINLDRRLETIQLNDQKKTKDQSQKMDAIETDKLDLLKVALARNLARAIVSEGSILSF